MHGIALMGIDRLFLTTGYTVEMVHQSKTINDAAEDAGLQFIVHLGIFGNGRTTDPHFAWHEMVERYIEGQRCGVESHPSELLHGQFANLRSGREREILLVHGR